MLAPDALEYLARAVEEQADLDKVPLAQPERQMLRWSEVEPGAFSDPAASAEFGSNYDSSEYEAKVARLLQRARERRTNSSDKELWADAVEALKGHDYYLLVMLKQSKEVPPARQSSVRDNLIYVAVGLTIAGALFYYVLTHVH